MGTGIGFAGCVPAVSGTGPGPRPTGAPAGAGASRPGACCRAAWRTVRRHPAGALHQMKTATARRAGGGAPEVQVRASAYRCAPDAASKPGTPPACDACSARSKLVHRSPTAPSRSSDRRSGDDRFTPWSEGGRAGDGRHRDPMAHRKRRARQVHGSRRRRERRPRGQRVAPLARRGRACASPGSLSSGRGRSAPSWRQRHRGRRLRTRPSRKARRDAAADNPQPRSTTAPTLSLLRRAPCPSPSSTAAACTASRPRR